MICFSNNITQHKSYVTNKILNEGTRSHSEIHSFVVFFHKYKAQKLIMRSQFPRHLETIAHSGGQIEKGRAKL